VLHHIIFITACAQNVFLQHKCKRWTLTWLANSTFQSERTRAAECWLTVDAPFQFVDLRS